MSHLLRAFSWVIVAGYYLTRPIVWALRGGGGAP
jgi:hypothetical protein